jgi:hypothetical protein
MACAQSDTWCDAEDMQSKHHACEVAFGLLPGWSYGQPEKAKLLPEVMVGIA